MKLSKQLRSESVVERLLTNWLSMGMYDSLKGNVGRSLFLLYKAIKHQTNKGPVDVVTNEAKYSLAEENLLREKIDPTILVQNWFLRIFVNFEIFFSYCKKTKENC